MKQDYVAVIYNKEARPVTTYPDELAEHLALRFSISAGSRLLDVGYGRGDFLAAFHRRGIVVAGVDQSPFAIENCKDFDVHLCNVAEGKLPFADASFDVVFHKSLLEHLVDPEPLMAETLRILKPGGRLIAMVPDWMSQIKIYYDDHTHCRPYTVVGLRDLMEICGFDKTEAEIFYQLPILWKHPALVYLSRVLQLFVRAEHRPKAPFVRWSVELMVLATGIKPTNV